jgi:hypothetical protein
MRLAIQRQVIRLFGDEDLRSSSVGKPPWDYQDFRESPERLNMFRPLLA